MWRALSKTQCSGRNLGRVHLAPSLLFLRQVADFHDRAKVDVSRRQQLAARLSELERNIVVMRRAIEGPLRRAVRRRAGCVAAMRMTTCWFDFLAAGARSPTAYAGTTGAAGLEVAGSDQLHALKVSARSSVVRHTSG